MNARGRTYLGLAALLMLAAFAGASYVTGLIVHPQASRSAVPGPTEALSAINMDRFVSFKLVIGSSLFAELEPCGCTKPKRGGLSRRATWQKEIAKSGPVVFIEGGNSLAPLISTKARPLAGIFQARTQLVSDFLQSTPCRAIGIGSQDLSADNIVSFLTREQAALYVASNLTHPKFPFKKWSVLEPEAGLKVAVFTIFDQESLQKAGLLERGYSVSPPKEVLKEFRSSGEKANLAVVFNYCHDSAITAQLVDQFPEINVVVESREGQFKKAGDVHCLDGKAVVLSPRAFGTHAIVLTCYVSKQGTEGCVEDLSRIVALESMSQLARKRSETVVDKSEQDKTRTARLKATYDAEISSLRGRAEKSSLLYSFEEVPIEGHLSPDAAWEQRIVTYKEETADVSRLLLQGGSNQKRVFLPASDCRSCHEAQFKKWSETRHSHAFATLEGAKSANNAECISCHSTGFLEPGGIATFEDLGRLKDVQCMACHQPDEGRAHPGEFHFPKVTRQTCLECHTPNNSPGFNYEKYLRKGTCQPSSTIGEQKPPGDKSH